MNLVIKARIQGGAIVLDKPLDLPEGTELEITVDRIAGESGLDRAERLAIQIEEPPAEPVTDLATLPAFGMFKDREDMRKVPEERRVTDFATLPFFGMSADRDEMKDSVAYVRKLREQQWQQRLTRPD